MSSYDYVIIGAGTAGCVLAARLSEDPAVRVALLEAGGEHDRFLVRMPLGYGKTIYSPDYSWCYQGEDETHTGNPSPLLPRGRLLGGSSAINGMVYIRGQPADYDDWCSAGATGWDWQTVKPWFLKAEDHAGGASEWHGAGGPLRVEGLLEHHAIYDRILEAGQAIGLPRNEDFNGATQAGIGYYDANMRDGRRWSAADGYLEPARSRGNLTVLTGAQALGIILTDHRATGVNIRRDDGSETIVEADREVLLCGGAFNSPQLLQLSGIGPPDLLAEHGLEVRVAAPQVGENLHDHFGPPMTWVLRNIRDSFNRQLQFPRLLVSVLRYALRRRGVMALPAASIGIFADSSGQGGRPDLQFHILPLSGDPEAERVRGENSLDPFPGLTLMPYAMRPKSRGHVRLRSADPLAAPRIWNNYFGDPEDLSVVVAGMRLAQRIADAAPLAGMIERRERPLDGDDSDAALEAFARENSHTGYHPVGTCRMGSDADSVVDCELRVRGVDGLRVVDASVMPRVVSGNTNATVVMIAEKAAAMIG